MPASDFDNVAHNEVDKSGKYTIDNDFMQQRMKSWQPLLTASWVIATFFIIGCAFIPIGVGILLASNSVSEFVTRYDNLMSSTCNVNTRDGCTTTVNLQITENMNAPVYFYYELSNYFQNHRRYVQSRSDAQLVADIPSITWTDCKPLEMYLGERLYPCGLIANTVFNDTFAAELRYSDGTTRFLGNSQSVTSDPDWQKDGIAWKTDVQHKYIQIPESVVIDNHWNTTGPNRPNTVPLPNVTDEDFIVWMRVAAMPTFRKLHRIINRDIPAGTTMTVNVSNIYPVGSFDGTKSIVVSTVSWMGGKNTFLGWAFIAVGIICIVLSIIFALKVKFDPRNLADPRYLNFSDLK